MSNYPYDLKNFIECLDKSTSSKQILDAMKEVLPLLNFENVCYFLCRKADGVFAPMSISTYPPQWIERYLEYNYLQFDPVLFNCMVSTDNFLWKQVELSDASKKQKLVLQEAEEFGLVNGASIPLHGPGNAVGGFSVVSSIQFDNFEKLWKEHEAVVNTIARLVHKAVLNLPKSDSVDTEAVDCNLTDRERECLFWASRGKTQQDTAQILGISFTTVRQHIEQAISKLGASNKSHAVTKAIISGAILPSDIKITSS